MLVARGYSAALYYQKLNGDVIYSALWYLVALVAGIIVLYAWCRLCFLDPCGSYKKEKIIEVLVLLETVDEWGN